MDPGIVLLLVFLGLVVAILGIAFVVAFVMKWMEQKFPPTHCDRCSKKPSYYYYTSPKRKKINYNPGFR